MTVDVGPVTDDMRPANVILWFSFGIFLLGLGSLVGNVHRLAMDMKNLVFLTAAEAAKCGCAFKKCVYCGTFYPLSAARCENCEGDPNFEIAPDPPKDGDEAAEEKILPDR
ncbi:MAG: hypothetical protein LBC26_06780 [Oscillospiraceae bacterium]|nr:hypothetical protein [Oscillospiraceae bacterium]